MVGNIKTYSVSENKILVRFEKGEGRIEIITPWVVNVFSPIKYDDHYSTAIEGLEIENCEFSVSEENAFIQVKTGKLIVNVFDDFKVDFYDADGYLLCEDYRGKRAPFVRRGELSIAEAEGHKVEGNSREHKIEIIKKMVGDEKFYGLGDKTGYLNKKGHAYEMWNTDDPSPHVESHKALYKAIPFFITLRENHGFGIFFDNTFKTYFDMGKENSQYYYFGADDGNLDYYFIGGPSMKDIITNYTKITGKTPLPQMWTLGYQQSRWAYAPESRLMEHSCNEQN